MWLFFTEMQQNVSALSVFCHAEIEASDIIPIFPDDQGLNFLIFPGRRNEFGNLRIYFVQF